MLRIMRSSWIMKVMNGKSDQQQNFYALSSRRRLGRELVKSPCSIPKVVPDFEKLLLGNQ